MLEHIAAGCDLADAAALARLDAATVARWYAAGGPFTLDVDCAEAAYTAALRVRLETAGVHRKQHRCPGCDEWTPTVIPDARAIEAALRLRDPARFDSERGGARVLAQGAQRFHAAIRAEAHHDLRGLTDEQWKTLGAVCDSVLADIGA